MTLTFEQGIPHAVEDGKWSVSQASPAEVFTLTEAPGVAYTQHIRTQAQTPLMSSILNFVSMSIACAAQAANADWTPPPVADATPPPVVDADAAALPSANADAALPVANATPPPVADAAPPPIADANPPPVVDPDAAPPVANVDAAPPHVADTTPPPVVNADAAPQPAANADATPPVVDATALPVAGTDGAAPLVANANAAQPPVTDADVTPSSVADADASPRAVLHFEDLDSDSLVLMSSTLAPLTLSLGGVTFVDGSAEPPAESLGFKSSIPLVLSDADPAVTPALLA